MKLGELKFGEMKFSELKFGELKRNRIIVGTAPNWDITPTRRIILLIMCCEKASFYILLKLL